MIIHPYNAKDFADSFSGLADLHAQSIKDYSSYFRIRGIDHTPHKDLFMLAPRLPFENDNAFRGIIDGLRNTYFICAAFVPDPLYCPDENVLKEYCERVIPFKTHYIFDYANRPDLSKNHERNIRYARKRCDVRRIDLSAHLDDWNRMWRDLVIRHNMHGWSVFSQKHFESLAAIKGLHAHGAYLTDCEKPDAISLWIEGPQSAVAHLTVCSAAGYKAKANYAIYAQALSDFRHKEYLDFGCNAGLTDDPEDGLSYFKSGFSNTKRQSYICGIIIKPDIYNRLCASQPVDHDRFFPAYRYPAEKRAS